MNDYRFWWDEENIDHIADHGVEPYEAEYVTRYTKSRRRGPDGKYVVLGQTASGRYLMVVFAPKTDNWVRVVTARDQTSKEKGSARKR